MSFNILFTEQAKQDIEKLESDRTLAKRLKAVRKAMSHLQLNPRHPGLRTHKYHSICGKNGEEIFEAYAENKTPAAYRIFWHYGPSNKDITILTIVSHP